MSTIDIDSPDTTSSEDVHTRGSDHTVTSEDDLSRNLENSGHVPPIYFEMANIESRISELETTIEEYESLFYSRDVSESPSSFVQTVSHTQTQVPSLLPTPTRRQMTQSDYPANRGVEGTEAGKIKQGIYDHPQSVIYAVSVVIMMTAVFTGNPILAVAGGLLFVMTGLHYGYRLD